MSAHLDDRRSILGIELLICLSRLLALPRDSASVSSFGRDGNAYWENV